MKFRIHNETSFSAKMVLLFGLLSLAVPERKKGIEQFVKNILGKDSAKIGEIPVSRIAGQAHFQSGLNH